MNGFAYGLDNSLVLASGDNLGEVRCEKSKDLVDLSGCDLKIFPDSGKLEPISGRSQYIRSRNDYGDWFGSDNSRPMYHYPIEERYVRRVPDLRVDSNMQQLFDPPIAPPVFPRSKTLERFNDLFASNRFTSACSAVIFRSGALGSEQHGSAFICEPVHNLVHNAKISSKNSTYIASRFDQDSESEFLASTDPWFRPVRAIEGTDGMLWIVDMYRQTIEHPEWIPQSWQSQLDLRAGEHQGRIYRVVPKTMSTAKPAELPNLSKLNTLELVDLLESDSGALRDLVQQVLLTRSHDSATIEAIRKKLTSSKEVTQIHALWCLHNLSQLTSADIEQAAKPHKFALLRNCLQIAEYHPELDDRTILGLIQIAVAEEDPAVDLQLALSIASLDSRSDVVHEQCSQALINLLNRERDDVWLNQAILTSSSKHITAMLNECCKLSDKHAPMAQQRKLDIADDLLRIGSSHRTQIRALLLNH